MIDGVSPSGKALGSGSSIRGFESLHPSQIQELELSNRIQAFLFANNKKRLVPEGGSLFMS